MRKIRLTDFLVLFSAMVISLVMAATSHAAPVSYDLTADDVTINMPDGAPILMWGFGLTGSGTIGVPGPVLEANEGDDLTINLTNNLPEAVTIIIHGQRITSPTPVMVDGRVMSFVPETASFTFPDLKAGTYLYESGTHPAKQVQMGLYGVLIVRPATAGQAYNDPVSAYDQEEVLVFSDIDPLLHAAVQNGTYGTAAYPSTVDYRPQYFLINGKAYPDTEAIAAATGERVLLRMANAGLKSYEPMINGLRANVIAEDGNLLPFPVDAVAIPLHAGKTSDAIVIPSSPSQYALFDRRLNLTNAGATGVGGMLTYINASGVTPVTVTFVSAGAQDGWLGESLTQADVGQFADATIANASALRIGDQFVSALLVEPQLKSIVSFDTSSLPDGATIQAATLRLIRGGVAGINPFTTHAPCYVDIVTGSFGGNPALAPSDFQAAATAAQVAVMSNPAVNGAASEGLLNAAGLAAINKIGLTQLKVYFAVDDNDDGTTDAIGFFSGENAVPANRPVLEVTYLP
ncbi:MAG: multicopper oxidase family protein [Candidatus Abyssobacteria bacterium SURF_5]|uniref:Multicopper oxidase family protein n=1 Tax=Abyssobacteria bacterium (strain SURF_5) TaxID=2093360 RepID=A0A3A4NJT8_ABYX5|nr:MAG: multicopper oxidase family protein [Candidatus Abyssubacteria bacterium SURF_5]